MLTNKYLQLVLFHICIFALGLEVDLSAKDNVTWSGSNIIQTATSIKKITNDIFFALKLKKSKSNERFKQYAVTYNYFSSIASKDDENLHQISIASRVDNAVGNVSRDLVDVINEVLNEEPGNSTEDSKHDDLQVYMGHLLKNLEYLKNSNGVNNMNYDIDNQILQLLRSDERDNVTKEDPDVDDDDSSDNEFWRPGDNARRIYKGENTKVRHFPFMASIHIFQNFQCGGSIIKSDLVITAASCLQLAYNNRFFRENPAFLSVRIGSNYYFGGGESIPVFEVYFHPMYDPKSLNNNVAIMRLDRRIKFKKGKSRVKKIEIDRCAHRLPKSGIKKGVTVIGWGAQGVSNVVRDPWTNRLSVAVLGVYYLKDCQDIYTKKYVTKKHFCVGFISKGSGACGGDVGGPGIIADKLAGIISFGSPRCGTPDAPTVFTKVGYYADWIDEIMEQEVHSEVNDYENLLDNEYEAEGEILKKGEKQKKITTTPAGKSDSEITDSSWDKNSDDEEHKTILSYQTTAIVENNAVPLVDDHELVGADTPADGDINLNVDDSPENDGDILEEIISTLIKNLEITDEKGIDKLLGQLSYEIHSQETFKEDKKPRKNNDLDR